MIQAQYWPWGWIVSCFLVSPSKAKESHPKTSVPVNYIPLAPPLPVLNAILHTSVQCLNLGDSCSSQLLSVRCWQQQPFFRNGFSPSAISLPRGRGRSHTHHPCLVVGKEHLSWELIRKPLLVYRIVGLRVTHCPAYLDISSHGCAPVWPLQAYYGWTKWTWYF